MGVPDRHRFRVNLTIFVGVNALLALAWAVCSIAGIALHGFVWPWLVVMALWAVRLVFEGRRIYSGAARQTRSYNEEQIQREMKQMR